MTQKSLMEFICEAIDEVLPVGAGVTGRDLYMRGCERHLESHFETQRKLARRELDASMPLLALTRSEVISWSESDE